jgi:hypothetical protein
MESSSEEVKHLYKFDYYEVDDNCTYVDWVWLEHSEVEDYKSSYAQVKMRVATQDEENLYEEAYEDGYGIAMIMEMRSIDNGVTFRVELSKDGDFDMGHKMFRCALCDKHKDFEEHAATAGAYYITQLVDDVLWHVCEECVVLGEQIDEINLDD